MEIEQGLDEKLFSALRAETAGDTEFQRAVRRLDRESDLARQQFFVHRFYVARDESGRTFAQRWLESGRAHLSNDERVLLERTAQMCPALLEIHHVLDDSFCEAVDLIETERRPFLLPDRRLAARAVRFMQMLGWTFAMPHYRRVHGVLSFLPESSQFEPEEVLRALVAHLGGPVAPAAALRDWLAQHLSELDAASRATADERRRRMFAQMDAKDCQSVYTVRGDVATLLRRLERDEAFVPNDLEEEEEADGWKEAFDCFDVAAPLEPGQIALGLESVVGSTLGRPLLGRVLVGEERLFLQASASARLQALKMRLEKWVGDLVEFVSERVEDLAARTAARVAAPDLSLVPPALLEGAPRLALSTSRIDYQLPAGLSPEEAAAAVVDRHQRLWIDSAVPALGGKTPRVAAQDPAQRPALIRLLKPIIRRHDERMLETGGREDINWLPLELGLDDLNFPPPPERAPAREEADLIPDDDDEVDELRYDPPPALPARPWTEDEVIARLEAVTAELPDPEDAWHTFEEVAPELAEAVAELTGPLQVESVLVLIMSLTRAWFTFFPPGTAPADFDIGAFLEGAVEEMDQFVAALERGSKQMQSFLESGPQPALTMLLSAPVLQTSMPAKRGKAREMRMSMEEMPAVLGALRAFIAEADRAARQRED